VTLDQSASVCLLRFEGEIKIACAAELKSLLLEALASGKDLQIDLQHATELDLTALQLLWAARRQANDSGAALALAGPIAEEVLAAASDAGFEKFPVEVNPE
jgi:anti-anti-sigma factor